MRIFKEEFSDLNFRGKRIHVDLGFQGIKSLICNARVVIPRKKPKGKSLDAFEKGINQIFSSFRVKIENAIAGCKHFLINQIRSRVKQKEQILENFQLTAGLHNYKLKFSSS
jgi:hypothetical protein